VRIHVKGFAHFEKAGVVIARGQPQVVDAQLVVFLEKQKVTVKGESSEVSVSPTNNVGALVLKGADLNALSDNPDDMQNELQALAGPEATAAGNGRYILNLAGKMAWERIEERLDAGSAQHIVVLRNSDTGRVHRIQIAVSFPDQSCPLCGAVKPLTAQGEIDVDAIVARETSNLEQHEMRFAAHAARYGFNPQTGKKLKGEKL
jgi:hypothetical protein